MSLLSGQKSFPNIQGRTFVLICAIGILFACIIIRLFRLQVVNGEEYFRRSQANFVQTRKISHSRGEVYDRNGNLIISNRIAINVYLTPAMLPSIKKQLQPFESFFELKSKEIKKIEQDLYATIESAEFSPILILQQISGDTAKSILETAFASSTEEYFLVRPHKNENISFETLEEFDSKRRYDVYLEPKNFPSKALVVYHLVEQLADEDPVLKRKEIYSKVSKSSGLEIFKEMLAFRDVSREVWERIEAKIQSGELPGVSVHESLVRYYPYGETGGHIIGYVNEISQNELDEQPDKFEPGSVIGRRGIEKQFEDFLRGQDGEEKVIVDAKGRKQNIQVAPEILPPEEKNKEPIPGARLFLTIDWELQQHVEKIFDGLSGAIVVMNVKTGELLSLLSKPSYNPAILSSGFTRKEKKVLDDNMYRPWRNKAIQDYYAPGSTYKIVTALAALHYGVTNSDEKIFCPGYFTFGNYTWRCWKKEGHGEVNLRMAIAQSCDTYFYEMGKRLGINNLSNVARDLGFGQKTDINIDGEQKGLLPDLEWYKKSSFGYQRGNDINMAIGQGAVVTTPIQLAIAFSVLANGQQVIKPQIVKKIETVNGDTLFEMSAMTKHTLHYQPKNVALILQGLDAVVNEPYGTTYKYRLGYPRVAGKTGTAQVQRLGKIIKKNFELQWKERDHAWFAALAPSSNPEIAVVVFHEHGGSGSSNAAPYAMKIIQAYYDLQETRFNAFRLPLYSKPQ